MKADQILRQAADVIEERGKLRDKSDGERSMARAVDAFNTLTGTSMTELDGWLFMSVLKIARGTAGQPHLDDFTDLAGYAALAAECVSEAPTAEDMIEFRDHVHGLIMNADGSVGGIGLDPIPPWVNRATRLPTEEEVIAAGPTPIPERARICCMYPNPTRDNTKCMNCGHTHAR